MFTLKIETDNEAFADGNGGAEVGRILRRLADLIKDERLVLVDGGKLMDVNGNSVGEWENRP